MKKWFSELSNTYKTSLISGIVILIGFLGLTFGYFIGRPDLPNGFLAGGLIGAPMYFLLGLVNKKEEAKQKPILSIVIIIVRFLLLAGLLTLSALLQFKYQYKILNTFLVLAGYFVSFITYIIIVLIEKKHV